MTDFLYQPARRLCTLLVLVGLSMAATSSQAAAFRARFDPQFSSSFFSDFGVDLWWRGFATISVEDACYSNLSFLPNGTIAQCPTTLDGYSVDFFAGDPENNGSLLDNAIGSGPPNPTDVYFDATGKAADMRVGPIDLDGNGPDGLFEFGTGIFAASLSFSFDDQNPGAGGASLLLSQCLDSEAEGYFCPGTENTTFPSESAPRMTWTRVPEPASLALVGLALVAMRIARRRVA